MTTRLTLNGWHVTSRCGGDESASSGSSEGISNNITRQRTRSRAVSHRRAARKSSRLGVNGTEKLTEPSRPIVHESRWPEFAVATSAAPISGQKGRYTGKFFGVLTDTSATGDLALGNIGSPGGDCEIWHTPEFGAGVKTLAASDLLFGFLAPPNATRLKPILVSLPSAVPNAIFAVQLASTSGSAGNATTPPSWVYTVKNMDGDTIATGQSPQAGRSNGYFTAATLGLAFINANTNTFKLLIAFESPGTEECVSGGG